MSQVVKAIGSSQDSLEPLKLEFAGKSLHRLILFLAAFTANNHISVRQRTKEHPIEP